MTIRFIAGAVCPQCQQMDKIFVHQVEGEDVAECKACGHQRLRPESGPDAIEPVEQSSEQQPRSDGIPFVHIPD